jgi:hypothetical protein
MPVAWLRPLCKDTWTLVALSAMATVPPILFHCRGGSAWSLSVIALTQSAFQAWCYNTGSHPALSPFQAWGILPGSDSNLYYTAASDLLNGQQITGLAGGRHSYPVLLAVLLKLFRHDLWAVTLVSTFVMALATWSAFEVIRLRLGGLAATVFLICTTFYIRIHCTGLLMTEQLGFLYSLCATGLLVESIVSQGKAKAWLYCGGLFLLTQALNARPAAYMTLPFLIAASWKLFQGNLKVRGRMVVLSAIAVSTSLFLHSMTYYWVIASPTPSNAWYCIYGMLNGGTWIDGRKHLEELLREKQNQVASDRRQAVQPVYVQALRLLREECLAEISHHPDKLLEGWWRALSFLWAKNTPFRSAYPQMPSVLFTEFARWCTVLGLALSLVFLLKGKHLAPELKIYQALSWINLAALLGMITSLPFAPPWDGETRIYAATLPFFFLLPASGAGGLYLMIANRFGKAGMESKVDSQPTIAIGSALVIGGMLSMVIISASWYLVGTDLASKNRRHPVGLMVDELTRGAPVGSFDLRTLQAGYQLRITDDSHPTWLPNISRRDFIQNIPRGRYLPFSSRFKQVPPGAEVVVLPYWIWLVLDAPDAQAGRFTPTREQTGHFISPPAVYFSEGLHLPYP